jgi:hypothetical protein
MSHKEHKEDKENNCRDFESDLPAGWLAIHHGNPG